MKIVVIGTVNRDTIVDPQGEIRESLGGLLYSLFTLALCAEEDTQIIPVSNLGQDAADQVLALLKLYPQIITPGIQVVPEMNNHAILTYRSEGEREEVLEGGVPPLTFDQIAPFLSADILLMNFISGQELSVETLRQIRSHTTAPIYADLHSLTLGVDRQGRRYWHQFPQWPEWVTQMDVVQMNRAEAQLLSRNLMQSDADFFTFGKRILERGPTILLVTLGAKGSAMITSSESRLRFNRFSPYMPSQVRDTTGCGDVFLAAFLSQHAFSGDPGRASRFANRIAGARCGLGGIEELRQLCEFIPKGRKSS